MGLIYSCFEQASEKTRESETAILVSRSRSRHRFPPQANWLQEIFPLP